MRKTNRRKRFAVAVLAVLVAVAMVLPSGLSMISNADDSDAETAVSQTEQAADQVKESEEPAGEVKDDAKAEASEKADTGSASQEADSQGGITMEFLTKAGF